MKTVFAVGLVGVVLLLLASGCEKQRSLVSFEGRIFMHTTKSGSEAHDLTLSAKGDKLRFDTKAPDGSPSHAVYDGATNQLEVFLDSQKSYLALDFSAPKSAANTSPTTSTITKAGAHKLVSGYDCEEWSVRDASGHRSDVCIAQGIAYFDPARLRPGATQEPETALAKEFREKKSFPLESIEYDTGGAELSRMEVVKIEAVPVNEREFAVPDGYAKVDRGSPAGK